MLSFRRDLFPRNLLLTSTADCSSLKRFGMTLREEVNRQRRTTEDALSIHFHFVVRVGSAFHHHASKLDDNILRSESARQSELENARVGVGQPVILDHVFTDDVGWQHCRAAARSARVTDRPFRDERQIAGLCAQRLYSEAARDLDRVKDNVV